MAERKAFIFYIDWKDTFYTLPDDKAGQLIKHMLTFVAGDEQVCDDLLINAVFANMKNTLIRDTESYNNTIEKRSKAGKISAEKRQHMLTRVESVQQDSTLSTKSKSKSKNDNKSDNDSKKEYSSDLISLNEACKKYFDEKFINAESLECFDKLIRIDKFTIQQIKQAILNARAEEFWNKNFISPVKLRKKDKEGIMYIDRFLQLKKPVTIKTILPINTDFKR